MKFRLAVLDGWRGLSILAVLAAHWLPLGPSSLKLNEAAGPFGMAIFFVLSGFLVTRLLLDDEDTVGFLIRRFFRIVPLAWAGMTAVAVMDTPAFGELLANFFFVANVPPVLLMPSGTHFWSLCLEIQFYLIVALLVRIFGRKALWGLPLRTPHNRSDGR